MDDEVITKVLRAYGMEPTQLLPIQKGYRNESHGAVLADGRQVNLIIYKSEQGIAARIARANRVGDYLALTGMPARRTADKRVVRLTPGRYAAVYDYLPGNTIPWEAYTKAHIKLLGQAMATMHSSLRAMPQPPVEHEIATEYLEIAHRMAVYFSNPDVQQAVRAKLNVVVSPSILAALTAILHVCKQLPGQQVVHMDFVRGNVLFDHTNGAPRISGIIDFEKTGYGHPLFDVARTYAFLLVDCTHKTASKVQKYFLQSGYAKQAARPFCDITIHNVFKVDISLFESLLDLFLLHDFYKFLRHTPYEALHENDHYMRTKQILINRNIISAPGMVK